MIFGLDKDGYIKDIDIKSVVGYAQIIKTDKWDNSLIKPRWNGNDWVEGMTTDDKAENEMMIASQINQGPTTEQQMIAALMAKVAEMEAKNE